MLKLEDFNSIKIKTDKVKGNKAPQIEKLYDGIGTGYFPDEGGHWEED